MTREAPSLPEPTAEEAALFPAKLIRVTNGELVKIEPWGMETGRLLAPRVGELVKRLNGEYHMRAVAKLIREAQDEVYEIVRITLGWEPDAMNRLAYEDLFTLAQAVVEVCLFRSEDAGGVMGKALALAALRRAADSASNDSIQKQPAESKDEI